MPDPKEPCKDVKAPTSGAPVETVTRVTTFGERPGAEPPPRRKLPPDHGPLPTSRTVDPARVLNRGERKDEMPPRREEDLEEIEEEKD